MANKSPQDFIKNIFNNLDGFVKSVENAEGMNLSDDQKKEFKEKFEREGGNDLLKQIKAAKEQVLKGKQ